jgi:hypothetical protein
VIGNTTLVRRRTRVSDHRLFHVSVGLKPAGATFRLKYDDHFVIGLSQAAIPGAMTGLAIHGQP